MHEENRVKVDSLSGYTIEMLAFPHFLCGNTDKKELNTVIAQTNSLVLVKKGSNYKTSSGAILHWSCNYLNDILKYQGYNIVRDPSGKRFFIRPCDDGTYDLVPKAATMSR